MKIKINKKTLTIGVLTALLIVALARGAIPDTVAYTIENSTGTVFTVDVLGHVNATGNIQVDLDSYLKGDIYAGGNIYASNDMLKEAIIDMDTACASGNHLYVSGNDFACEVDDDTPDDDSEVPDAITVAGGTLNLGTNTMTGLLGWNNLTDFDLDVAWVGKLDAANITVSVDWVDADVADALTIAGGTINLDTNTFTNRLGYDNLTLCSDTQILKVSGSNWACAADATGAGGNTTEEIQDAAWDVTGGTQTGITVTYQDGTNDVDFVVTDSYVDTTGDTMTGDLIMENGADILLNDTLTVVKDVQSNATISFDTNGGIVIHLQDQ